jgi:hypothetical protein
VVGWDAFLSLIEFPCLQPLPAVPACPAAATFGDTTPFDYIDPGVCIDHDAKCGKWAAAGECQHNAKFMVGDVGSAGRCPRSCGTCTACADGDKACYDENRRRAGYLVFDAHDLGSNDT